MKGQVVLGKQYLSKAFVRVYPDSSSTPVLKLESDADGWIAFQVPLQKFYTVKISKPGYVTKIISVDAHLPKSQENGDYYFEFAVELFENIQGLDVSILKDPIAKIFFNTFTKKFDYDYNYTVKINGDLKKMYHEYDILKKQGKTQAIVSEPKKEGDRTAAALPDTSNKNAAAMPVQAIKSESVSYSVEILSSSEQLPRNSSKFKGMVNTKEYKEGDLYKYYVGDYATREEAQKMKERIAGYFPEAFIVQFKEGKRIGRNEAMNEQGK